MPPQASQDLDKSTMTTPLEWTFR